MLTEALSPSRHRFARLDVIGSALSTLCAIHCLAMPLVVGLLPVLGLGFLGSRGFERGACLAMMALAVWCLVRGCRRHRRWWLLGLLGAGAALTLGIQFFFTTEACAKSCCTETVNWSQAIVMFLGGSAIAASHLLNLRFGRACSCCAAGAISSNPLAGSGGVRAWTSRETPRRRTGRFALGLWIWFNAIALALPVSAAHSDIILTGGLRQMTVDENSINKFFRLRRP